MRGALWLISAPLVMSGLAWAVGVAEDRSTAETSREARPSKGARGNIFYFSRSGKSNDSAADDAKSSDSKPADVKRTTAKPADSRVADLRGADSKMRGARPAPKPAAAAPATRKAIPDRALPEKEWAAQSDDDAGAAGARQPQKYVRSKAELLPAPPAERKTKNYYHELFEADDAGERDGSDRLAGDVQLAGAEASEEPAIEAASHDEAVEHEVRRPEAEAATTPNRKPAVVAAKYEERPGINAEQRIQQVKNSPAAAAAAPKTQAQAKPAPNARPMPNARPATAQRPTTARPIATAKPAANPAAAPKRLPVEAPAANREPLPELVAETPVAETPAVEAPVAGTPAAGTSAPAKAVAAPTVQASAAAPAAPATASPARPVARVEHAVHQDGETRTSHAETPVINLRWLTRGEVNVGQECRCGLEVKNSSGVQATDVLVEAYFPRSVRLLSAEPYPTDSRDHLSWRFETLAAGEEKVIEIVMIPAKRGELATSATVRFTGVASNVLTVEEPQLQLTIKGPQDVSVGEAATQVVTVSNPGTGVARDVIVQAVVPEGLEHARGKKIQMSIGSLSPGESRDVRLALAAVGGGDQILQVEARGSANLVQSAESQIKVSAPRLEATLTGPSLRYVNRHAQYAVTVTNKGAAETNNVRVSQVVPVGFEFVKADHGGLYNPATRTITWFLGQIEAGQSSQMVVELAAKEAGTHEHKVHVTGENGSASDAGVETKVEGAVALVMEVNDTDDPVEVKSQTSYEVRVKNEGSKAAQNLTVTCLLPEGVEIVDAEGPTAHQVDKGVLTFQSIPELGAKQSLTFRIRAVGTVPGNLRFRAKLSSDSTPEPLVVEELTKFYAD